MGNLGPTMSHPASQLSICYKDCFTILHNERGQERYGNVMLFLKEIFLRTIWSFWKKYGMTGS